jgi:hypothetical protein
LSLKCFNASRTSSPQSLHFAFPNIASFIYPSIAF